VQDCFFPQASTCRGQLEYNPESGEAALLGGSIKVAGFISNDAPNGVVPIVAIPYVKQPERRRLTGCQSTGREDERDCQNYERHGALRQQLTCGPAQKLVCEYGHYDLLLYFVIRILSSGCAILCWSVNRACNQEVKSL
jgi:hypothetical protein